MEINGGFRLYKCYGQAKNTAQHEITEYYIDLFAFWID